MIRIFKSEFADFIETYIGDNVSVQEDSGALLVVSDVMDGNGQFAYCFAAGLGSKGAEDIATSIDMGTLSDFVFAYLGDGAKVDEVDGAVYLVHCDGTRVCIAEEVQEYTVSAKVWGRWNTTVFASSPEDAKERGTEKWYEADFGELHDIDADLQMKENHIH